MITTYDELQTAVANWLSRADLTDRIPEFIQLAEERLRNDQRVTSKTCRGTFTITQDGDALPEDYYELESWYHDGPTYYGDIEIVGLGDLSRVKARRGGGAGAPRYAAITDNRVYYAPEPDATYETRMAYRRKIVPLSAENTTNWLLDENASIYLNAALCEAAPFLEDDNRVPLWEGKLDSLLNAFAKARNDAGFTGKMKMRSRRAIGG